MVSWSPAFSPSGFFGCRWHRPRTGNGPSMAWRGWSVWNGSLRASCSLVAACRWDPWRAPWWQSWVDHPWRMEGTTPWKFWTDLVLKQAWDLDWLSPMTESPYLSHKKEDGIWPWQKQGLSLPKMTREIGDSLLKNGMRWWVRWDFSGANSDGVFLGKPHKRWWARA